VAPQAAQKISLRYAGDDCAHGRCRPARERAFSFECGRKAEAFLILFVRLSKRKMMSWKRKRPRFR
jgi:hypothetical protein